MKFNFSAINLGCNKNLVDTEFVIGKILSENEKNNINFFSDPLDKKVEFIIINTCGFLSSSREEAEETINYYDDLGKKIIITGCYLPVRDNEFLLRLKNLYLVLPMDEEIENNIKKTLKEKVENFKNSKINSYFQKINKTNINKKAFIWNGDSPRLPFNLSLGYEYVKISEGCDNRCSFCIIPQIRGNQKSREIEDIVKEIENLVNLGAKEIEIISQDTTRYGIDLYEKPSLFALLEEIEKINLDFKFRLFYMYPDILTLDNLKKLKNFKKFIPYFDLPFQHINPKILKRMGRFYDDKHITSVLDFIKNNFKDAFIHTNFIVGFPGEQEKEFNDLLNFAEKFEFDSVSMFGYHDESLAASSKLDEKNDDKTIEKRVKKLAKVLDKIYEKKEENRKGKEFIGYIYDFDDKNAQIREEKKAPELDELDVVPIKNIQTGILGIGEKVNYIK
ncbi:MAG: MiaB/RimO family radical SAM methylthiotransferase [Candidatus Gracilibacteria bacterium]|nr:MiaB/RimO family radical SAM methylthiotransferase [Candidatus Gracilibacteria bacterium]